MVTFLAYILSHIEREKTVCGKIIFSIGVVKVIDENSFE